jgi:hypothetical protein
MSVILVAYSPIPILLNEISDKPNGLIVGSRTCRLVFTLNIFKAFWAQLLDFEY